MAAKTRFLFTNFDVSGPRISDQPSESTTSPAENNASSTSNSSTSQGHPLLRREHTKSRRGCLNCKRRRIKCPENHPACAQCTKRGLLCEWPALQIQQAGAEGRGCSVSLLRQLDSARAFTMQDFRLFNHFVQDAHPFHPIGNEERWTHDIPSIAHNHDFLLHSMLALAASDLSSRSPDDSALTISALSHRIAAIKALHTALSRGVHTMEEGNAMLATCYTLVFQSALMADAFPEYMSFIRGCMVVAWQMGTKRLKFVFDGMLGEDQLVKMGPFLKGAPDVQPALAREAIESLQSCEHLVVKESERAFHACCLEIAHASAVSSRRAYMGIMKIYGIFAYYMSAADFHHLIDPANQIGLLLQAHLIALQTILEPVLKHEVIPPKPEDRAKPKHGGSVAWLDAIHGKVGGEMREWFEWPMRRAEDLRRTIEEVKKAEEWGGRMVDYL